MLPDEYEAALEKLLLELARIDRQISTGHESIVELPIDATHEVTDTF